MAKTIKDMAISFGWTQNEDSRGYAAFCFAQGAKAILSEIENIITSNEDNTLCMARCLVDKIRELKREE